jgi:molybdate transport system substrate-binding protein
VLGANPDFVCVAVAKGEVEMCVHQISEIMPVKGVTLVGPLPKDVQRVTRLRWAGLCASTEAMAAAGHSGFVSRPDFKVAFAKAGLDHRVD